MDKSDIKMLYDAFVFLCDYYIEKTDNGCSACPMRDKVCFNGNTGNEFARALRRIREEVNQP